MVALFLMKEIDKVANCPLYTIKRCVKNKILNKEKIKAFQGMKMQIIIKNFLFKKKCVEKLLTNGGEGCIMCAITLEADGFGNQGNCGGAENGDEKAPKESGNPRG